MKDSAMLMSVPGSTTGTVFVACTGKGLTKEGPRMGGRDRRPYRNLSIRDSGTGLTKQIPAGSGPEPCLTLDTGNWGLAAKAFTRIASPTKKFTALFPQGTKSTTSAASGTVCVQTTLKLLPRKKISRGAWDILLATLEKPTAFTGMSSPKKTPTLEKTTAEGSAKNAAVFFNAANYFNTGVVMTGMMVCPQCGQEIQLLPTKGRAPHYQHVETKSVSCKKAR